MNCDIIMVSFISFCLLTDLGFINSVEPNDLYSSPNIVRVIKSRIMRWAGHVVRMGEERGV